MVRGPCLLKPGNPETWLRQNGDGTMARCTLTSSYTMLYKKIEERKKEIYIVNIPAPSPLPNDGDDGDDDDDTGDK